LYLLSYGKVVQQLAFRLSNMVSNTSLVNTNKTERRPEMNQVAFLYLIVNAINHLTIVKAINPHVVHQHDLPVCN
jgi:hypothetical protein